jgi:hypothetical protein
MALQSALVHAASPDGSEGHILFLRENTLMAQPFDVRRLALAGEAVPIAESVTRAMVLLALESLLRLFFFFLASLFL